MEEIPFSEYDISIKTLPYAEKHRTHRCLETNTALDFLFCPIYNLEHVPLVIHFHMTLTAVLQYVATVHMCTVHAIYSETC